MGAEILNAGATIMSGRSRARDMVAEAQQYEIQARGTDLQAVQSSERRREDYRAQLAAVEAGRSQLGASLDSPTAIAIEKEMRRQSVRDEGVERLGFRTQADSLRRGAAARRRGAKNAIMASYLEAGATVWKGAQDRAAAGKFPFKKGAR